MSSRKKPASTPSIRHSTHISDLETHIGFWLRFVSNHVSGQFRRRVEAHGVSVSEWVALRQLFTANGTSASALMDALGMTKGAVSKIVTRLEAKGLIERAADTTDRRAQSLVLTTAGRALVPTLAQEADENDAAFFGHLTPAQQQRLIATMQDIVRQHGLKEIPVE
ncbi:MarR family transcriptional regulator [Uliginosibacterium sp. H3]|uniref:MarR family transcriptional regulator n=1 Tax=Uliginosibacterium silvisoli TaxID=3114758 RepID=A0ABU6K015_9RHOO|nr:MarR family transcriptional regulator [Uliginosibacterium sp. H3]